MQQVVEQGFAYQDPSAAAKVIPFAVKKEGSLDMDKAFGGYCCCGFDTFKLHNSFHNYNC